MSQVTTHVLDTARGRPAEGITVALECEGRELATATTDSDGRVRELGADRLGPGTYTLRFDTDAYFEDHHDSGFYPEVTITFSLTDAEQHYHVPLLLSPFGYSTYRGS